MQQKFNVLPKVTPVLYIDGFVITKGCFFFHKKKKN